MMMIMNRHVRTVCAMVHCYSNKSFRLNCIGNGLSGFALCRPTMLPRISTLSLQSFQRLFVSQFRQSTSITCIDLMQAFSAIPEQSILRPIVETERLRCFIDRASSASFVVRNLSVCLVTSVAIISRYFRAHLADCSQSVTFRGIFGKQRYIEDLLTFIANLDIVTGSHCVNLRNRFASDKSRSNAFNIGSARFVISQPA